MGFSEDRYEEINISKPIMRKKIYENKALLS
jgi:hypothetical protein